MLNKYISISILCLMALSNAYAAEGTFLDPKNLGASHQKKASDTMNINYFSFEETGITTAGINLSVKFTIDASAAELWPYFKDFNSWFNGYGYYFKGEPGDGVAIGDMEGQMMRLGSSAKGPWGLAYTIDRVVPRHLMVFTEIPRRHDGFTAFGYHSMMLTEYEGKTLVTVFMQHASRSGIKSIEEMLAPWRQLEASVLTEENNFWLDILIPKLRSLVKSEAKDAS